MRSNEHIEEFKSTLMLKNNLDKCPFLTEWFNAKFKEIDKLPDEHDRKGIAKGDRLPVPKTKRFLALHDVVFKKLRLKEFCEIMGINHGTGRNWRNTDRIFRELASGFTEEFSHAFLRRYSKLVESRQPEDFLEALKLIRECRHYPAGTAEQIRIRLKHYGKQKKDGSDPLDTVARNHKLLFSILLISLKDKDEDRRKYAQTMVDQESQDFDAFFKKLREDHKSSGAQSAIDLAETKALQTVFYYVEILKEFID